MYVAITYGVCDSKALIYRKVGIVRLRAINSIASLKCTLKTILSNLFREFYRIILQ